MNLKNIFVATALLSSAATMAQRIDGHYEELNFTENVPANLPQLLSEKSITIDPGHGGYGGDDRKTDVEFGLTYWESTGNFATANFLYAQLEALGCDVSITRIKNDIDHKIEISPESDPSIKERVDFAELMDADFFHSVHTNGVANKTSNYHLMLYASLDKNNRSTAQFPIAKDMSNIMSIELPKVVYTVGAPKVYADLVFQPKWSSGYGILNGTSVPAIISEASFHSNPAEGRRLRSKMYQEAMATQMTKSYLKLYGVGNFNYGEVKGVVDHANNEELNNVTVGAYQNNVLVREVATDNGYNGYYFMGWLAPGEYEIKFSRNDAEFKTELVTVNAMEEVLPRLLEPAQVTFKEIKVNDDDTYTFKWNKIDSDITGYKLFYSKRKTLSSWKLVADDAVLTADKTEYTVSKSDIVTTSLPTLYFKMVAINRNDTEVKTGAESRVYSTSNSDAGIKALIVDGFDRLIGANSANKHSLSVIYADALSTVAEIKSVSTVDNTVVIDTDVLLNYDVVYWISGEESS
ncbi:MAG: N-acetylmuramoyl-L-alanine amidase, partial [Ichthyobacteriaceae bacterium]|nr:N-acetylmuramoyl-L-alanine amidase [Ichthyobacteriaceae bacterium]